MKKRGTKPLVNSPRKKEKRGKEGHERGEGRRKAASRRGGGGDERDMTLGLFDFPFTKREEAGQSPVKRESPRKEKGKLG